jgi:exodeoxyribonuclease VII large subunit
VSRKSHSQGESLWGDLPEPEPEADAGPEPRTAAESEAELAPARSAGPPDWALPSWDALPEAGESGEGEATEAPAAVESGPVESEAAAALRIMQVSEVTRAVRDAVRLRPELRDVWVEGEVGRVTVSAAGHAYFTLKDERSQLSCVFFRDERAHSAFEPQTGLRVVAHGRVDVFETQGVYQLYVTAVQPAGFGDLALRFEALKARLAAEGLFESARKRQLPARPAVIGVATSATGAVWHDICQVVSRRWPMARLILSPCQVQGEGSAQSVVAAMDRLARWREICLAEGRPEDAPDVVILARGGGSLEDLWSFNDERVVRAVVAHPVPVVCGVGHEVDVTLADFAADVRAPTPSAAAELVVPDRAEMAESLSGLARRAGSCVATVVAAARAELASEGRVLDRLQPSAQLAQARERAGYLLDRAARAVREQFARRSQTEGQLAGRLAPAVAGGLAARRVALERAGATLAALAPQATLDRGYAIVRRRADGVVVRSPAEAPAGEPLAITVAGGEVPATVDAPDSGKGRS